MGIDFELNKYDVGGKGAVAGDGKLNGDEVELAKADGFHVWEGYEGTSKRITEDDMRNAENMSPRKAVDFLLTRSPLGLQAPNRQDLENSGYANMPVWGLGLYEFISPYGNISGTTDFSNNNVTYTYKTNDGYIQTMTYDKDGNLLEGTFSEKDDAGTYKLYSISRDKNGNLIYTS